MTRGALTTFSIANDVAKYFAIIPAMFAAAFPVLGALNIMQLKTPQSAILSAVIFNAVIIIALIPLALRGVAYRPMSAAALLRRNLLIYGVGGLDRAVHRHQAHRRDGHRAAAGIERECGGDWRSTMNIARHLVTAVLMTDRHRPVAGHRLSASRYGAWRRRFSRKGERAADRRGDGRDRFPHHRPGILVAGIFHGHVLPPRAAATTRRIRAARNLGPTNRKLIDCGPGESRCGAAGKSGARRCRSTWSHPRLGARPDISPAAALFQVPRVAGRGHASETEVRRWWRRHRGSATRFLRRAAGQRAGAQSRARRAAFRSAGR